MNYSKPQVTILGNAVRVIELTGSKPHTPVITDSPFGRNPAYDLDE